MRARVISETDARKGMCATRKAILTDARNGLLDNGRARGTEQIKKRDAGNPSNPWHRTNGGG